MGNHHNDFQWTINGVAYEWDKTAEGCMEICIAVGPEYCTHFTVAGSGQCDMVVNSQEKEDAPGYTCYELNLFTEFEGKDCGGSKHSNYDAGSLQRWNHHNDFQRTINGVAYEWDKTAEGCMEICIAVGPEYCPHFTVAGRGQCDMVVNSQEKEDASGYTCYELKS